MPALPDLTPDALVVIAVIRRDPSLTPPSGRLLPLLLGQTNPKRRRRRLGSQIMKLVSQILSTSL